jgi:hypothetical protein
MSKPQSSLNGFQKPNHHKNNSLLSLKNDSSINSPSNLNQHNTILIGNQSKTKFISIKAERLPSSSNENNIRVNQEQNTSKQGVSRKNNNSVFA